MIPNFPGLLTGAYIVEIRNRMLKDRFCLTENVDKWYVFRMYKSDKIRKGKEYVSYHRNQ